jgi:D-serine deaminase-like pyridoxal phosphate-dependent protein
MRIEEIDTPALLVDLDSMESNLRQMAEFFRNRPCKVRPHFKNHKSPQLAQKQLENGAIGITCATLREAEILVDNGFKDILIANQIVGESKLVQLAELLHHSSVILAIDNDAVIRDMARIQRSSKTRFEVVVDVNIGLNRCGVLPGEPVVELAKRAVQEGLFVRGIMGYDGHLQAEPPSPERDVQVRAGSATLAQSAALLEEIGIPVSIVSTGGTGTYSISGDCARITDIQAGSYLLMDTRYMELGAQFCRSLTILSAVISRRELKHAILDCGMKEISSERGLPKMKNAAGVELVALHAEHGLIQIDPQLNPDIKIVRNGEVEEVFRIEH